MLQEYIPQLLDPYSKAKYDTIKGKKMTYKVKLDPYSKAKYDTIYLLHKQ